HQGELLHLDALGRGESLEDPALDRAKTTQALGCDAVGDARIEQEPGRGRIKVRQSRDYGVRPRGNPSSAGLQGPQPTRHVPASASYVRIEVARRLRGRSFDEPQMGSPLVGFTHGFARFPSFAGPAGLNDAANWAETCGGPPEGAKPAILGDGVRKAAAS